MMTTIDKAIAGGVVSLLANIVANYLHVPIPDDVKTAAAALIVAVMVWVIPNKQVTQ